MLSGAAEPVTETVMSALQFAPADPHALTCRVWVPEAAGTCVLMEVPLIVLVLVSESNE